MKKLGKLSINPEKVIKNDELVNLRGGYGDGNVQCECGEGYPFSYNDCTCSQAMMDRNLAGTCAPWDFGWCFCAPCV